MNAKRRGWMLAGLGLYAGLFLVCSAGGGLAYFHFSNPKNTCASCHEMTGNHAQWSNSAHRSVHCRDCHGGSLTLDVHAIGSHLNRVVRHFTREDSEPIHIDETQVLELQRSCRTCHPQAYAEWQSSRHATTYARIFLDASHNRIEPPANDCLRCHGMFLDGDVTSLVTPLDTAGPWTLKDPRKANQPAIPCLACHQVHAPSAENLPAGFYNRRETAHVSADRLPVPEIHENGRAVKVSRDPRQRGCMQCHAAEASHQLGSSDDRTPSGVHEGLSCLDCHRPHSGSPRASCSACHPADSNCGLDVEKMDTTFLSSGSTHDIHRVRCVDCHREGIPDQPGQIGTTKNTP